MSGVAGGCPCGAVRFGLAERPQWRAFTAYAAAWEPIPDEGLRRYPEARPR